MSQESVLVTGASSGIGLETALHVAGLGYHVYAGLRDPSRGDDLQRQAAERGVRVTPLQLDTTKPEQIEAAVAEIARGDAPLYGLVNNAGVILRGYFEDVDEDEVRRVFETNLFGTMTMTRAVLPALRERRRGRIIIMSSTGGRMASPGNVAYCSSKFALEGFGECVAQELEPFGVRVSLIEPGFIKTALFGRNRNVARRAADPASPYAESFERLERLTDEEVRSAVTPPSAVAETVANILGADRPRLRYVVGSRAKLLFALRRHIPGEIVDRLLHREIRRRLGRLEAGPA